MAKDKTEKTNVMRLLEQKKLPYTPHDYLASGAVSGVEVAAALGEPPERVFKTLVTTGASGGHYVFVIPVAEELDLKKAAKAVGEKSIVMLPQKELLPLTGYIHGGCSPIGMKKPFPTVLHESAADCESIYVSAGKIGLSGAASPQRPAKDAAYQALRCDKISEKTPAVWRARFVLVGGGEFAGEIPQLQTQQRTFPFLPLQRAGAHQVIGGQNVAMH